MSIELSPRQRLVLAFINRYRESEQCNPTMRQIADEFGWSSANAATEHMRALARKDVVTYRDTGRYLVNFAWRDFDDRHRPSQSVSLGVPAP